MPDRKLPFHERANTYLFLSAALGGIAVLPYVVGQNEAFRHHPWQNGWIVLAAVIWVLGVLALLSGAGIYSLHIWRARRRRIADRKRDELTTKANEAEHLRLQQLNAAQAAQHEAETHRWQCHVWETMFNEERGVRRAIVFELDRPEKSVQTSFTGATAVCEVRQSAHIYAPKEPAVFGGRGRRDSFTFVFPDDFEAPGSLPQPSLDYQAGVQPKFLLIWRSAAFEGYLRKSFTLDYLSRINL